jgi:hypothetical protein
LKRRKFDIETRARRNFRRHQRQTARHPPPIQRQSRPHRHGTLLARVTAVSPTGHPDWPLE